MVVVFIIALIAGLLMGVAIMLFGIERTPSHGNATERGARQALPLAAAFAIVFAVAGYSLLKVLPPATATVVALAIGLIAALVTRWLVAKSEAMPVEHDVDDERYV